MDDYKYDLPKELIALEPAVPRDSSRLLIYNTASDTIAFDLFTNIPKYIPQRTLMVMNSTSVLPSRLTIQKKSTGGKVIVLILLNEVRDDGNFRLMIDRKVSPNEVLLVDKVPLFEILAHEAASIFVAKCLVSRERLLSILNQYGSMPIPLYLRKTELGGHALKEKYQTVFATQEPKPNLENIDPLGSVAAPTASLHFTKDVLGRLQKNGVEVAHVSLEVGLGTFAPLDEKNIQSGELHPEWYHISDQSMDSIRSAKNQNKKILACGTTVVRTLESFGIANFPKSSSFQSTKLFIRPGHEFHYVDMLITNFHLPESSLMMLVQAFLQSKGAKKHLTEIYKIAVDNKMRFFSFGDAMLII